MATPYSIIFDRFLSKISDRYLLSLDANTRDSILLGYLIEAIEKFQECKQDLSDRDDTAKVFNIDLTNKEISILANLMRAEWLEPQINSLELLRQGMSTKDFKITSQANHLKELLNLKKEIQNENNYLLVKYTYSENSLDDLYD